MHATLGTMSDEQRQQSMESKSNEPDDGYDDEDDDDMESPFDHPAFLPVVLWALSIWFGYDGWINQDPDMLEHSTFNRWGFVALTLGGIYYTIQAVRELRDSDESDSSN